MRVRKVNDEVLVIKDEIVKVSRHDIDILKKSALRNPRKRIRLCAHRDIEDKIHEMLIMLTKDTYVRPHKHLGKSESFHVIEGSLDVVVFDDEGNIIEVVRMGDYFSGRKFYYRLSEPYYHIPLVSSDYVIFHETTNGPFRKEDTIFAPWAPEESDNIAVKEFRKQLERDIERFISHHNFPTGSQYPIRKV